MAEPQLRRMTQDEFFAWQERQDRNYELVDGIPVLPPKMMTGASQVHDRIVVNIIASLHGQLRGSSCRPTTDDLAVRIPGGNVRRPDITIECGKSQSRREYAVGEPRVMIEVLSPSTMNFDRIRKIPEYQLIATVTHILLVDTEAPRVDVMSRKPDERWVQTKYDGLDAKIDLPSVGATLALVDVYEEVDFEPPLAGPITA